MLKKINTGISFDTLNRKCLHKSCFKTYLYVPAVALFHRSNTFMRQTFQKPYLSIRNVICSHAHLD